MVLLGAADESNPGGDMWAASSLAKLPPGECYVRLSFANKVCALGLKVLLLATLGFRGLHAL